MIDGPARAITRPFEHASPQEGLEAILAALTPVETETIHSPEAAGRMIAARVVTDRPSPPADVSAMDGFALRAADGPFGRLPIAGEVRIGYPPSPLPDGTCMRIVTGAAIPPGANAIVKREDVAETATAITIASETAARLSPGLHIRRRGENAPEGTPIAEAGQVISPALASALAAVGAQHIRVFRRLKIAILTTGDELTDLQAVPTPWQIRDSNGPALQALLGSCPWIAECHHTHVPDDPIRLRSDLSAALDRADAVLLTGGVSAGHRDYVPAALDSLGVRTLFHRLPQRPGMPILAGTTADGRPILGLPGNPLSVMVSARRLAWPALARRAGITRPPPPAAVTIENADDRSIPLWWHRLAHLTGPGRAAFTETRGSGDIISAVRADGFVEIPPNTAGPGPWPFFAWRP